ncbi:hypothetical protein GCM10007901_17690 [Dyella acidisoli]|uniref:Uncharacterized protein n=1 Tax=Dyella acidisoli TaxID=1867834 RepID=A0ABQ5XQN5_9GAMM|nr:hypothetical protein GCM10007901_17690 [Dyella acidisoli]
MILLDAGAIGVPHYHPGMAGREHCSRHSTLTLPCKQGRGLYIVSWRLEAKPSSRT